MRESVRSDDHADGSARQQTLFERLVVAGGAIVAVSGFLAVLGGLVAGTAVSLYAWPVVGIGVLAAGLGLEWFAGRPIRVSVGIRGIDSIGTLLLASFGLVMGVLFLWALGAALWWSFRP